MTNVHVASGLKTSFYGGRKKFSNFTGCCFLSAGSCSNNVDIYNIKTHWADSQVNSDTLSRYTGEFWHSEQIHRWILTLWVNTQVNSDTLSRYTGEFWHSEQIYRWILTLWADTQVNSDTLSRYIRSKFIGEFLHWKEFHLQFDTLSTLKDKFWHIRQIHRWNQNSWKSVKN